MTEQIMETLKYIRLPNVLLMYMTEGKYISVLIGTAEDNQENVIGTVKEIGMAIADSFHQTAPIGLGKIYSNVSNITYSYMQSCYSATAASDKRTDGILLYTDISQDLNTLYYPTELETKLINSTKHSEIKQIEGIFRVLYKENIEKRHLSQSMEKVLISNIAATLLKIYNDVMMDEEVNSIMEMVFRHHELSYALRILLELFVHVGQRLSSNRNDKEQIYANELRKYIEDSYNNPQLCVTMAAERFALSESYFSQFFKEMIGEAFSSYLEKVRISKAKYLILNCDYDIETITAMVGYNNSGTFRRAFKRVTGISPSTWKETE
jgi:YesN/AraC family two-component response regulator